jgi:hypothetical protein
MVAAPEWSPALPRPASRAQKIDRAKEVYDVIRNA